jgi:hypothetical protein
MAKKPVLDQKINCHALLLCSLLGGSWSDKKTVAPKWEPLCRVLVDDESTGLLRMNSVKKREEKQRNKKT